MFLLKTLRSLPTIKTINILNRKIKLIWDLRNLEVKKMASDHCENLKYFATREKTHYYEIDSKVISENYAVAYMIVDEKDMIMYRDALKPHRAEVAK